MSEPINEATRSLVVILSDCLKCKVLSLLTSVKYSNVFEQPSNQEALSSLPLPRVGAWLPDWAGVWEELEADESDTAGSLEPDESEAVESLAECISESPLVSFSASVNVRTPCPTSNDSMFFEYSLRFHLTSRGLGIKIKLC